VVAASPAPSCTASEVRALIPALRQLIGTGIELAPNVSIQASIRRDAERGAYSETLINRDISLLAVTARDA
jgi:hypothetical protein